MLDLSRALNDAELDELDEFLLSDATGEDGCLDVSTLHGFFTATVSGPLILPSEWKKPVFGAAEAIFNSIEESEKIYGYILRLQNEVADLLNTEPESYEPWFTENRLVNPPVTIVDEWCDGYARAMSLRPKEWENFQRDISNKELLTPILAFAYFDRDPYKAMLSDPLTEARLAEAVAPNAVAIHARWREKNRHRLRPRRL